MSFNLPNPCLLGILFVVSTHSGPQLVYQYPSNLSNSRIQKKLRKKKKHQHGSSSSHAALARDANSSSSDDDVFDDEDDYDSVDSQDERFNNDNMNRHADEFHELELENEWDSGHLDYYMGTKKDIFLFLDEQEKLRKFQANSDKNINSKLHTLTEESKTEDEANAKTNASFRLNKTISGISLKSSQSRSSSLNLKSTPKGSKPAKADILGFEPDYLSEILCPPRQMCNSRFELMIEDMIFLGLPIHNYDDGSWRRKKKKPKSNKSHSSRNKLKKLESALEDDEAAAKNADDDDADDEDEDDRKENGGSKHSMNMFHMVFIMNPPIIECNYRIDEMFHYVISRLSLVLRYEQLAHEFVWNQVKLITKLKDEYSNLKLNMNGSVHLSQSDYLISKSSLARLISDCYLAISSSSIANLSIHNKLRSFQIPIKTEFHSLPEATVPFLPGSHLSSTVNMLGNTGLINVGETTRYGMSNMMTMLMIGGENPMIPSFQTSTGANAEAEHNGTEESDGNSNADDIIYFALLLLDDPETIIKDIKAELYKTLADFIRMIKPTESLLKLSNKLKQRSEGDSNATVLDISQIKSFAFHLIYWRRARVIPPLSTRSVYIVSPMAPITINLYKDLPKFKLTFPTLPSLPHFLKLFSTRSRKPAQFATVIPSKDHRDVYLTALGWLIRFGYVTQLHTFLWLKISRKIKMRVDEDLEIEASKIAKRKRDSDATDKLSIASSGNGRNAAGTTDNTSKQVNNGTNDNPKKAKSKATVIASSFEKDLDNVEKAMAGLKYGTDIVLEEESDTIILDPGRATTLERRWINKIIYDECNLSSELMSIFYKLLKYMNGKNSLELLLLKENISRHELRKLLFAIEDHIISVRHW